MPPSPEPRTFQSGDVIAGRYELRSLVGEGGMGSVWRACHIQLTSEVAIKLMSPAIAAQPEALDRFLREARAAARLSSLHVVKVFDYGVDEQTPYIAMELLSGESLRDRLDRERVLSPADALWIARHAARALSKAHAEGIVHRDLKPENLFITHQEEQILKVLDFGVAKLAATASSAPSTSTRTGAVLGTPFYMSPEQARGIRAVDHRSDLWAFGVIVFECLTGKLPFDSEAFGDLVLKICTLPAPVPSSVARVPPGFDAWFARAVERDPELRFQSADEMFEALQLVLSEAPSAPVASQAGTARAGALEPAASTAPTQAARHGHSTRTDGTASQTLIGHIPTRGPSPRTWALALAAMLVAVAALVALRWQRSEPAAGAVLAPPAEAPKADAPVTSHPNAAQASPSAALTPTGDEANARSEAAPAAPRGLPIEHPDPTAGPRGRSEGVPRAAAASNSTGAKSVSAPRTTSTRPSPGPERSQASRAPAASPPAVKPAKPRSTDLFSDPD